MLAHLLNELVGQKIILEFIVARSGLVIHKSFCRGTLRGRPCKHNINDYDMLAIRADKGNSITYIDPRVFRGDKSYMVTLEQTDVLGKTGLPVLCITFDPDETFC